MACCHFHSGGCFNACHGASTVCSRPLLFPADRFFSGTDVRHLFWLPVLSAGLSLLGMWIALDMGNPQFLVYAAFYLALGLAAMGARAMYRRRMQNPENLSQS